MTKSKKTKRALLSSALALVLCFVMLLGTTFAWFTDTASTGVNKIQAGTLKIELLDENDNSLEGQTLKFIQAKDNAKDNEEKAPVESVLWEPGCTYELQPVTIRNAGNLALKYKIVISGVDGSAKLNEAIKWTITGAKNKVEDSDDEYYLTEGEEDTITISGHMDKNAGNEYQGLSISGVAVIVAATQYTYEFDSTTDQYDKDAAYDIIPVAPTQDEKGVYHITSAAEFVWFINNYMTFAAADARQYVLDCDINLGGYTITTTAEQQNRLLDGTTFDGQNYTVSNFTIDSTANPTGYYGGLFGYMAGSNASTIKNLIVRNATVIGGKQTGVIIGGLNGANSTVENCKVYDCTIIGEKKVGVITGYNANGIVKDCYAENCTVYCKDSDGSQATVYGYDNGGTFTNNTESNNTVKTGVTTISSVEELQSNLTGGKTAVLLSNLTYNNTDSGKQLIFETSNSINFDGNGKTITMSSANPDTDNHSYLGFISSAVNVSNLTVTGEGFVELGHYNKSKGTYTAENLVLENMVSTVRFEDKGFYLGCAFENLGTATLKNCKMTGATAMVADTMAVDAGFPNGSVTTVEGGEYGVIYCWTGAKVTIEGAEVGTMYVAPHKDAGYIMIKSGTTVEKIVVDYGVYATNKYKDYYVNKANLEKVVIEDGATVDSITFNGNSYTVATWKEFVKNYS